MTARTVSMGAPFSWLMKALDVGRRQPRALFGGFAIPVGQAVAAEAGEDHQVDVLHVGALLDQVVAEAAERGGFEFGDGLRVHREA